MTAPPCERRVVPVDLREQWTGGLAAAGFDRTVPTAWLAEGLLLYLTADEAARLLTEVGEHSMPGSRLAFEHGDIASQALFAQARAMPAMEQYTSLWKGGLGNDAAGWLSRRGWRPRLHDRAGLATSYGRPVAGPLSGSFLTAVRSQETARRSGHSAEVSSRRSASLWAPSPEGTTRISSFV